MNTSPVDDPEVLFAAWVERVESGEVLDFEELLAAHPRAVAEVLRELHSDWLHFAPLLQRVVPGLIASDMGLGPSPLAGGDDQSSHPVSAELVERLSVALPDAGRYRFRGVLGRGGGGVVLRVWDRKLDRSLAMKVVLGRGEESLTGDTPAVDAGLLARFVDEARIASQLDHPGIVPVHEIGLDTTGRAFFTMRLVRGEDLAKVLVHVRASEGGWTQVRALGVFAKVCEAVAYAHSKGVVHRDLKPANIMVGHHGEVHVMDWGLARVLGAAPGRAYAADPNGASRSAIRSLRHRERAETPDSPLMTRDGSAVGTPAYMSPEQARGNVNLVDTRSDVYALGAMLYELLTGRPPFVPADGRIDPLALLARIVDGPPTPLLDLAPRAPAELIAIAERAMSRDPADRYPDVLALERDISAYLERRVVSAYETGSWAETKKWVRRNRALAGALFGVVLLLVLGMVATLRLKSQSDRHARAAVFARTLADQRRAEAEWNLYVAAIRGAQTALQNNEVAMARQILDGAPTAHRNWEWRYLDAELDHSLLTLMQSGDGVIASFSPDGSRVLTSAYWTAQNGLWDASDGRRVRALVGHLGYGNHVSFSADGTTILTAPSHDSLQISDGQNGEEIAPPLAHASGVVRAILNADGSRAFSTTVAGTAHLWDTRKAAETSPSAWSSEPPSAGIFDGAGRQLLTWSRAGEMVVWDVRAGERVVDFRGQPGEVVDAVFTSDGEKVVSAFADQTVSAWDVSTGTELWNTPIASAEETVAGEHDLWRYEASVALDPSGGRVLAHWRYSGEGRAASIASVLDGVSGVRLVTHVEHWHESENVPDGVIPNFGLAVFSSDGSRIAVNPGLRTSVWLLDAVDGALITSLEGHTDSIVAIAFSPRDEYLATASRDSTVRLWDSTTGQPRSLLRGHASPIASLAFDGTGDRIVTGSWDGSARIWSARSAQLLAESDLQGPPRVRYSRDGRWSVHPRRDRAELWDELRGEPKHVRLGSDLQLHSLRDAGDLVAGSVGFTYDIAVASPGDNGQTRVLRGHTNIVLDYAFSPDQTRLVSISLDRTIRVWDVASGLEMLRIAAPSGTQGWAIGFTADGLRITGAPEAARVALGDDRGRRVWQWDSVPTRIREKSVDLPRDAVLEVDGLLERTLRGGTSFREAMTSIGSSPRALTLIEAAALERLGERESVARERVIALYGIRRLLAWQKRMAGMQPWPDDETERVDAAKAAAECNSLAWAIVDPDGPVYGGEAFALAHARRAVELEPRSSAFLDTLAWALFRVGQFDAALAQSRLAFELATESGKETYAGNLRRLEAEVAAWRGDRGAQPRAELETRIAELERQALEIEGDPDVRRVMRSGESAKTLGATASSTGGKE